MSAPPGSAARERLARLLVAAEVARRGGSAREARRGGVVVLRVRPRPDAPEVEARVLSGRAGWEAVPGTRVVVDGSSGEEGCFVVPPEAAPEAGLAPWRGRWDLLGL